MYNTIFFVRCKVNFYSFFFFFSSRRRHTRYWRDWSSTCALPISQYRAFFVGGGGYTLPRQMETLRPDAHIVVTEIDPGVTQTNFERMGLDPNTKIVTYNVDAREIVEEYQGKEKFDLVFGDAFNDLQIPYHLTTREFDQKIRNMLKDDGIYIALVIDKLRGGQFMPSYVRTIQTVFPHVYIMADGT